MPPRKTTAKSAANTADTSAPAAPAAAEGRAASEQAVQLLDAATAHVLAHGLGDLSLRAMAEVLGTSHRMLIYYFGSADGFWEALLRRIRHAEQRVRPALAEEAADPARVLELAWERYSADSYLPIIQLLFEIYGRAIRDRERFQAFLDDVVGSWMGAMADRLHRQLGLPPAEARLRARVELATMRGLLLDLVTTGDRKGTTAALKYFAERLAPAPR
ncbi:TetR family transcriptional regulator [Cupriavidus sp. USMAA2-4]|uniref:TetR/AcrR family transcriptional regulator n=1 Tax=unclassified Cupriavidus TaxID=2640874 RepID=UPI0008A6DC55|nr:MULTISPECIES: TetR/AcrR family transcriptional regulator [unclassified Cupriavidus]AOY91937.1 TetR family transcriptional regulator [Cupriavidus sp. USMAA2-4]AOY98504.1 TetR family transcriptional regulator [Cupriavidus sp. USMAHM13]